MDINYLGHSSFKIKTKMATLVTDPYDEAVGLKFPKVEADIVTISHDHHDHNQAQRVNNVKKVVSGPGEYEIMGVSIIGLTSWHDDKKGELRGGNTIYIIEADGMRLVHLGDLGHRLSEKYLEGMGDVDILMIPVGGEYTLGPKEAAEVVADLEPKIILPMHYQRPGLNQQIFAKLAPVEDFLSQMELKVIRETKLKVQTNSLPSEEQVIYLLS